jgi:hypothetical protein
LQENHPRLLLDGRGVVKLGGGQADTELGFDGRDQVDRLEGIAADIVEIVGRPEGGVFEDFRPHFVEPALQITPRRIPIEFQFCRFSGSVACRVPDYIDAKSAAYVNFWDLANADAASASS